MHSVLHTTPRTYSDFSPARSNSTSACVREGARTGSFFQRTLGFIRAIAGRKLHLQFLCAIPLFTFTHDACVMSTICQGLGYAPLFTGEKTIRVSYSHRAPQNAAPILQLGSYLMLAHRRWLCCLLPSTSWGSLLLHIVGGGSTGVIASFFCLLVLTDDMVGRGSIWGFDFFL